MESWTNDVVHNENYIISHFVTPHLYPLSYSIIYISIVLLLH